MRQLIVRMAAVGAAGVLLLPGAASAAVDPPVVVSVPSPYPANCNGAPQTGTNYSHSEVEPFVAVNPAQPRNRIAVWQQDRWSTGGANGVLARVSFDGGAIWQASVSPPFSRCAGGSPRNGGDYERATDPWVTASPAGDAYFMALAFNNSNTTNAMLVARSRDGGRRWGPITTLIKDAGPAFNDKNSMTADPLDSRYVYAVWTRGFTDAGDEFFGSTYFTRTTDGGATWEPARSIYDPGPGGLATGNLVAVLPDGTLLNLFTEFRPGTSGNLAVLRSTDKGQTWTGPFYIDGLGTVGVIDPRDGAPVRSGDILPDIAVDLRPGHDEVYVVWQDARFTGYQNDSIVAASSRDGGRHWTAPKRISPSESGQAFTGSVHVNSAGVLGVTYYDFTHDSAADEPLVTDYWIVRSRDGGATFDQRERMTPASFDMRQAPVAGGFFLGDYTGLDSAGDQFQSLHAVTTPDAPGDPTDMHAQHATGVTIGAGNTDERIRMQPSSNRPRPVITLDSGLVTRH
ncbi:hypothetical protein JOF56_009954 [Kibdelosporangium banguiense]|uniref:BNR repeat-like domain-containing protein n=1 Tax=Kibdelosporangium banguiense TaxID=1365924 RepID=A0ABS4TYT2_9PSEU|nr:sialidase family protein [Kibdelosporangium banguiense]MBP2329569.1 hypothetical protein [Kibdelosporangium banguiense]